LIWSVTRGSAARVVGVHRSELTARSAFQRTAVIRADERIRASHASLLSADQSPRRESSILVASIITLTSVSDGAPIRRETTSQWGIASSGEARWPALLAVALAVALQVVLPDRVIQGLGNRALIPSLEGALIVVILIANPGRISKGESRLRFVGLSLIALITIANVVSLAELVHALLYVAKTAGRSLVYASVPIWLTNVLVFGLWYWELDRGGPAARGVSEHRQPDFLFPQMSAPGCSPGWTPRLLDYLYTSFTNATAFSPTDTMPLTAWAKLLMSVQAMASLLTVAVVVSRAVNILS
jgi:uncharacterized membrane protein